MKLATSLVAPLLLATLLAAGAALGSEVSDNVEVADAAIPPDLGEVELFERLTRLRPRVDVWQAMIVDSDFGSSEVDTFISGLRGSVSAPVTRNLGVRFLTEFEAEYFNFHSRNDLLYTGRGRGDPFDELLSHRTRLEGRYLLNETWILGGGGFVQSRFERGAAYDAGMTGGGFFVVGHELWGQLGIVLGLGVSSRLDKDSPGVSPIIQLRWKVNDEVEIRSEGLGARIINQVSPSLKLNLAARFEGHRYRLDTRSGPKDPDDPASGPVGNGTLRDRRFHVTTGISWKFADGWRLASSVGVVAYHQYTSADHNGKKVDDTTANHPAIGGFIELRRRF